MSHRGHECFAVSLARVIAQVSVVDRPRKLECGRATRQIAVRGIRHRERWQFATLVIDQGGHHVARFQCNGARDQANFGKGIDLGLGVRRDSGVVARKVHINRVIERGGSITHVPYRHDHVIPLSLGHIAVMLDHHRRAFHATVVLAERIEVESIATEGLSRVPVGLGDEIAPVTRNMVRSKGPFKGAIAGGEVMFVPSRGSLGVEF